jgi:hypothetical protein
MAIRENTFLLKRSNVPGKVPLAGDVNLGEIALNTADVKLYASGTTENDIVQIGWDRISRTGDTVTGDFIFNGGITATTISATTYSNYPNDLPTGGTAGQILAKIDSVNYNVEWIENYANYTSTLKHEVKAGEAINKGQAVYVSSADGTNMIVSKASNVSEATSSKTMGLLAQNLANNDKGFLITEGLLSGLNTSSAGAAGDPVWLGTNGNLIYGLTNKPYAPAHLVFIGIVTRKNNINGEIFVKVQNGFELKEIHDVDLITTTPINGHILGFDGTLWVNKTIASWLGFTPVTNARTISTTSPLSGGGDLTADRTLSIAQATTSVDGYLSATDWTTFNNKANKSVATTGVSVAFATPQIYNTRTSAATGNITGDYTNAIIGVVQKIYHNDSVAPTFPGTWVKLGSGTYTTLTLNVIYVEWTSSNIAEYWIVKGV